MSPVITPNEPEHSIHVRSIAFTTIVSEVLANIDREMAAMRVMKNTAIVKPTMAV